MRYEWKKLLCRKSSWILFGIFVLFLGMGIVRYEPFSGDFQGLWKREEKYRDEFREERKQYLNGLEKRLELAPTEYVRKDLQKCYRMYGRIQEIDIMKKGSPMRVIEDSSQNVYQYLYLFFVLSFFGALFAREKETGMELLLVSSQKGKSHLFFQKIGAAILLLLPITVVFTGIPFFGFWFREGLLPGDLAKPVQCIEGAFRYCPYPVTVGQLFLVSCFLRMLAGMLALAVLTVCSVYGKRSLPVLLGSMIFCVGLTLLGSVKEERFARVMYKLGGFGLLNSYEYFTRYDTVNIFGVPVLCLTLAVCFTATMVLLLFAVAYGLFTKS